MELRIILNVKKEFQVASRVMAIIALIVSAIAVVSTWMLPYSNFYFNIYQV